MELIQLVVVLIVIGVLLWLVETQLPIEGTIKLIIRVVIIIAVLIWLLSLVGLMPLHTRVGSLDLLNLKSQVGWSGGGPASGGSGGRRAPAPSA